MFFSIKELLSAAYHDGSLAERSWQEGVENLSPSLPTPKPTENRPSLYRLLMSDANYTLQADGKVPSLDKIINHYYDLIEPTEATIKRSYQEHLYSSDHLQVASARMILTSHEILKPAVGIHIFRFDQQRNTQPTFWGTVREHMDRPPYQLPLNEAINGHIFQLNPYEVHNGLASQFISTAVEHGYAHSLI